MNLTIDTGNSFTKLALYDNGQMLACTRVPRPDALELQAFLHAFRNVNASIISAVTEVPAETTEWITSRMPLVTLQHDTPLPIAVSYLSRQTLGSDRLAGAVAAATLFPGKNALVIDFGTCIKYDFINTKGVYEGGSISPGLQMRFQALHTFTGKLPLTEVRMHAQLTGRDTRRSILSGVVNGARAEAEGITAQYRKMYNDLQVVLTGGDLAYFAGRIKSPKFARPDLVLFGLNQILEYHAKIKI